MSASAEVADQKPSEVILAATPLRIGVVKLRVRNLERISDYYRQTLGLKILECDSGLVRLGVGSAPLLELRGDPALRPRNPRGAGLFHTAFLMPTRGDLASWLRNAKANRLLLIGASDHAVSEAIYLTDPEGNGIEICADRATSAWRSVEGAIRMPSDPLDVDDLLRADPDRKWTEAPHELVVGHMHLQVGALPAAEVFYGNILGFDITCRYPGGSFFGAGGYHHQIATNIWNSRNAGPIDEGSAGLAGFEILVKDFGRLNSIRQRSARGGVRIDEADAGLTLRDPWGLPIALNTT